MIRKMLIPLAFLPLFLLFFLMWTCTMNNNARYNGDHPELYTVAVNNFLGCSGHASNGEIVYPSEIGILETDSLGRVLFYYHEGTNDGCGYGIMQKEQDGYAYFYEDDCVICAIDDWNGSGEYTHDEWFTQEEIDAFKVLNDWNKPIDETKCTKAKVVDRKPDSKLKPKEEDFDKAAKEYFAANKIPYTESSAHGYDTFFVSDNYGREIHFMYCIVRGFDDPDNFYLALMFNPDGTCAGASAVMLIEDRTNYREALKEFKQNNGWNTELQVG